MAYEIDWLLVMLVFGAGVAVGTAVLWLYRHHELREILRLKHELRREQMQVWEQLRPQS